jgi:acetylornithine/succinyldiaminopimelate/putrescine aminotransferase
MLAAVLDRDAGPVVDAARGAGLLVLTAGTDVLRLLPPLVVSDEEIAQALAILDEALR